MVGCGAAAKKLLAHTYSMCSIDTGWVGELTTSLNIVNIDSRENCYEYVDTNVKSMCG